MKTNWGITKKGETANLYKICCPTGEYAVISDYGATIVSIFTPDNNGKLEDIVLGYDTVTEYEDNPKNAGATIGRYANRIAKGTFQLEGKIINVSCNRPPHYIHGGFEGFDKKVWTLISDDDHVLKLRYISADGEEGFPGNVTVDAVFDFSKDHTLELRYEAETDATTVCSLTNHTYWNLNGHLSGRLGCENTMITVNSEYRVDQDEDVIPTGKLIPVNGSVFDLRDASKIGDLVNHPLLIPSRGIDHSYAVSGNKDQMIAYAKGLNSGRTMRLYSNLPAMQVYLGGNLPEGLKGKESTVYGKHSGFCMETQHFPDAPNHKEFPSPVLKPGDRARFLTRIVFGTEAID